jgi:hypothetical protein
MVATARFCPVLLGLIVLGAAPAAAQEASTPYSSVSFLPEETPRQDGASLKTAAERVPVPLPADQVPASPSAPRRVLTASYLGLGVLQTLDAHSTFRALDSGMHERNPLMRWASNHPAAFVALKGGATAGTILVAEKIRKKHPKRAIVFITAINAVYAAVVMHNYRVTGDRR